MDDYSWRPAKQKYGIVIHSFLNGCEQCIPLQLGQTVHMLEEYSSPSRPAVWYRGYTFQNKLKKGIFPASYIHLAECKVENSGPQETVTPVGDPVVKEATTVLREWGGIWKKLYVERQPLFAKLQRVMQELIGFRQKLAPGTFTQDRAREFQEEIVTRIDWGNSKLGLDLVPRLNGEQLDIEQCSAVQMFRLHQETMQNTDASLPRRQVKALRISKEGRPVDQHHLQLTFKSFGCNVGDESETCLSIYDATQGCFISERYLVRNTKNGMPVNLSKLHDTNCLFVDLSTEDVERDLYLVVHIFRCGRMLQENNSKKVSPHNYRRPWGFSVLGLRDLFSINREEELEFQIRIQCCSENDNLPQVHETLIKRMQQTKEKTPPISDKTNFSISISLKVLHGDKQTVQVDKNICIVPRLGFPEYIKPGEVRNDLYITLVSAEFERGNKTSSKNVEVLVTVIDREGREIPECIYGSCGEPGATSFRSMVYYHNNTPKWGETVRLSIPIELFPGAHVRCEFYHCSTRDKSEKKKNLFSLRTDRTEKRLYGFCFLPITDKDHVARQDGKHELCIYRCDSVTKMKDYEHLPPYAEVANATAASAASSSPDFPHSQKESVTIETFLVSTKFTQKADLLGVLQWSLRPKDIQKSLHKLTKVKGQEIVQYLQDILDALFNMFGSNNGEPVPFAQDVFETLVHIFLLVQDEMFVRFQCVLDAYLYETFSCPLVHRDLMECLERKIGNAAICADFDNHITPQQCLQVLEQIFKFTVKSFQLSQRVSVIHTASDFQKAVMKVFSSFGRVLSSEEKVLEPTQVTLLEKLHCVYGPLLDMQSPRVLAEAIAELLSRTPKDMPVAVQAAKMTAVRDIVLSDLFRHQESRHLLMKLCLTHVKRCLINEAHLQLTCDTLGDILDQLRRLKQEGRQQVREDIGIVVMSLFIVIVQSLLRIDDTKKKFDRGLLISCLVELLRLMDDEHYMALIQGQPHGHVLKDFLIHMLLVFRDLIKREAFNPDWTVMRYTTNHVILTAIQYVAHALTEDFLRDKQFDQQLWSNYFDLAVAFVTQPSLQLEEFSQAKQEKLKEKYQDMRVLLGFQIQTLWNGLGTHKRHFIPSMIGPFLEVTMVPERELRKATLPIFFDMMQCEQRLHGNFKKVEGELIEKMDILFTDNSGDQEYQHLFRDILLEKVQEEPSLQEDGKKFVISVSNLLERLLDYREVIEGDENQDKRMHCTFNILNFYHDIDREEMYGRYINKLYDLHMEAENFVEAGLTLQRYADLLPWGDEALPPELRYPQQVQWERKEKLYLEIITCFDKGKAWEYGIPLCKELATLYEKKLFNYHKLSEILKKQALFFDNIMQGPHLRHNPSYYRVAYYGRTFPPFVRNKAFVYRGDECLRLATLMNHLTKEFPSVEILNNNDPPSEEMKNGDKQYIQICNVKPVPRERQEFQQLDVPLEVRNFYEYNEVDCFQVDRPYHKGVRDKSNDFKTLWLERWHLKTSYSLPGILRWYEVVSMEVSHLSPLTAALENIATVNRELLILIERTKANPATFLSQLEMRLQGIISACVGGGIPKYMEAFLTEEFAQKNPHECDKIVYLKSFLQEQMTVLERGLQLQGKLATQEMMPLHKSLHDQFLAHKRKIGGQAGLRDTQMFSTMSVYRPNTPSNNSSGSNRSSVTSADAVSQDSNENVYTDLPHDPEAQKDKRPRSVHLDENTPPKGMPGPNPASSPISRPPPIPPHRSPSQNSPNMPPPLPRKNSVAETPPPPPPRPCSVARAQSYSEPRSSRPPPPDRANTRARLKTEGGDATTNYENTGPSAPGPPIPARTPPSNTMFSPPTPTSLPTSTHQPPSRLPPPIPSRTAAPSTPTSSRPVSEHDTTKL